MRKTVANSFGFVPKRQQTDYTKARNPYLGDRPLRLELVVARVLITS